MLAIILGFVFLSVICLVLFFAPFETPTTRLRLQPLNVEPEVKIDKKKRSTLSTAFRHFSMFNRPFTLGPLGKRMARDLNIAKLDLTPEGFFLIKELCMAAVLALTFRLIKPDMIFAWAGFGFCFGYLVPEFWLKARTKKIKESIVKELPDTIDLLGLCVNAGLDFMLALKWVVDKSKPSVLIDEMNLIMQEINVGKPRRVALADLGKKYELPDLTTFTRTLIQADRMGTSVAEALTIISEDMRVARFRRGEQIALKAPMKMLVPLLFCIFPVVAILVGAPIFLDFTNNNPMRQLGVK
ncbi:MAG TPA: type II secretion system F family protein [Candidatus Omnitrophota bacterium]|nr:type II secretion system F family protein [Candidatus Omnitrophota bacterium]HPD84635.1 type II secretion system F family protein [Candidatus Omnitrophota bacterium]HRZ03493.1 type II secretion system F family protein [Candidatus Omnitrophota bacterium]